MPKIKTRDVVKGTVKTIDKAAIAGERMKEAYVRTRDKADQSVSATENSPEEYAADRFSGSTEAVTYEVAHQIGKQGRKAVKTTKDNISTARERLEQRKADQLKKAAQKQAEKKSAEAARSRVAPSSVRPGDAVRQPAHTVLGEHPAIKTLDRNSKSTRQTARSTGKATIKTAKDSVKATERTVKTAGQTARVSVKTTQATEKAAQKSAQAAAKASRRAAQAARRSARAAKSSIKAAAKATVTAVKAIIAATRALISAILAGGWIAIVIIVLICMVALLIGSCFGIFFSSEDSGTGQTMPDVVREINTDYQHQLDTIKANISYDVLEMSGSRAVWPEVLSVYAVKTATDPDEAQEVVTMDDSKKAILKDIFWQMNAISSRTETKTETVIEEKDDGHGNIIIAETIVTRTYLYITVSHKTAEEMANQFGFNADQREQLAELLAEENRSLWSAVLYGIGDGNGEIVTVALSQIGNVGGEPYWSWYGFSSRVEWCACFVSWCANECGYIESGIVPKFAGVGTGVDWFQARGLWQDNSYEPRPGDVIFFDWDDENGQDGLPNHVGIVEKVEDGIVYTVEGNSGDTCRENHYTVGHYEIFGYGTPAY